MYGRRMLDRFTVRAALHSNPTLAAYYAVGRSGAALEQQRHVDEDALHVLEHRHARLNSASSVRRAKARSSSGCESHPAAVAPPGSNRSSRTGSEAAEKLSGAEAHLVA
jgi:hypothetical protein